MNNMLPFVLNFSILYSFFLKEKGKRYIILLYRFIPIFLLNDFDHYGMAFNILQKNSRIIHSNTFFYWLMKRVQFLKKKCKAHFLTKWTYQKISKQKKYFCTKVPIVLLSLQCSHKTKRWVIWYKDILL